MAVLALLLLGSLAQLIAAQTSYPCQYTSSIGYSYDLAALRNDVSDYAVPGGDYIYYMNICRSLITAACQTSNADICQTTTGGAHYLIGTGAYAFGDDSPPNGNGLSLNIAGGENGRTAQVVLRCNFSAGVGTPAFVSESPQLHYNFIWQTSAACPVGSSGTPTVQTTGRSSLPSYCTALYGQDSVGQDIGAAHTGIVSVGACCTLCRAEVGANSYAYGPSISTCWCKSVQLPLVGNANSDRVIGTFGDTEAYSCTYTSSIGYTYNLAALRNNLLDYVASGSGWTYYINVCRSLITETCESLQADICQSNGVENFLIGSGGYSFGDASPPNGNGLFLNIGSGAGGRTAVIALECNQTAGVGGPIFVTESPILHYQFRWATSSACPVSSSGTPTFQTTGAYSLGRCNVVRGYDYTGNDLGATYTAATALECCNLCQTVPGANAFAWGVSEHNCWCKGVNNPVASTNSDRISGVFPLVATVTTGVVVPPSPYLCLYTSSIGYTYNLSPLRNDVTDYRINATGGSTEYTFHLNVCRPLITTACGSTSADICQTERQGTGAYLIGSGGYGFGDASPPNGNGLYLNIAGGANGRTAQVVMRCSQSAGIGYPAYVSESPILHYNFVWDTSAACPTASSGTPTIQTTGVISTTALPPVNYMCTYTSSIGYTYNLSPLRNDVADYQAPTPEYTYYINVCRTLITTACGGQNADICQTTPGGNHWLIGSGGYSFGDDNPPNGNGLYLNVAGGDSGRTATVVLRCNASAGIGSPVFDVESPQLHYRFIWQTSAACPVGSSGVPTVQTTGHAPLPSTCSAIYGEDSVGDDVGSPNYNVHTPGACCTLCEGVSGANSYAFGPSIQTCWCKNIVLPLTSVPNSDRVIGTFNAPTGDRCVASVGESSQVTLDCGSQVITTITFASYGRPSDCPNPIVDLVCHSPNSQLIVQRQCVGRSSCNIQASNDVFGDPCSGIVKSLVATYTCGASSVTTGGVFMTTAIPPAQYVCSYTSSIGYTYDLSSLRNDVADYQAITAEYTYYINVCRSLLTAACGGQNADICQTTPSGNHWLIGSGTYGFGDADPPNGNGLFLNIVGGQDNRNARVALVCNQSIAIGSPVFESEDPILHYNFIWQTRAACPVSSSGSPTVLTTSFEDLSFTARFYIRLNATYRSFNYAQFLERLAGFIDFPKANVRANEVREGSVIIDFSIFGSEFMVRRAENILSSSASSSQLGPSLQQSVMEYRVLRSSSPSNGSPLEPTPPSKSGLSGGAIAGIVIAGVVVVAVIVVITALLVNRRRKTKYILREVDSESADNKRRVPGQMTPSNSIGLE